MKFIEKYKSPSFDIRKKDSSLNYIIIHYSAIKSYKEALSYLSERKNKVSSHFFINKSGEIFYLVDIINRAWHAGRSYWKGINDVNSESIGIEMDNSGHHYDFENYTPKQINSLIQLLKYISMKFNISKQNILGHSDVSPYRKIDPGEKFPWKKLARNNISYQPKIKNISRKLENDYFNIKFYCKKLKKIGYEIDIKKVYSKKSIILRNITKSFQMHFQQEFVKSYPNKETHLLINQYLKDLID